MFKIKSKFYVIYGDGVPIYVGFTSRTVHQRFSEHKKSKDLSDFNEVRVEELKNDELDFDFSWDYNAVENEANEVSKREAELVKKFGTQDSEFQKANGGGTVWNHIKYFVLTNKNNPKYKGMSGSKIHEYLENRKKEMGILGNFVRGVNYPSKIILGTFIGRMNYPSTMILSSFVDGVKYPSRVILNIFTKHVNYPSRVILGNFVSGVNHPSKGILHNFVRGVNNPSKVILRNFTGCMKIKKEK